MLDKVTIISVAFQSGAVLPQMLGSIPPETPVVIVNNSQADADQIATMAQGFGAQLVQNSQNTGFGAGCNIGAQLAQTDYLLFLNPDASLAPDALGALMEAAERHASASAFNPVIRGPSGKARLRRRSLNKTSWFTQRSDLPEDDCDVSGLSGAALFVRRSDFEAVGGFDPDIFLYHEDEDLCFRLRQSCGPLMFVRKAEVHHIGGASTPASLDTVAFKAWHMGRSGAYVARKNAKAGGYRGALARAMLQLASPLCWISRRKRVKQYAILRGVLSAAKDGGRGFKDTPWQE